MTEPEKDEARKMFRVNLGCGRRPLEGYLNVDLMPAPGVQLVVNLEKAWPWADNSVDEFNADDFVEHIRQWWEEPDPEEWALAVDGLDKGSGPRAALDVLGHLMTAIRHPQRTYGIIHVANEAWRCLRPHGMFRIKVPSTDGRGTWQDPTHVSYWNENSLLYLLENDVRAGLGSLMKAKFKIVSLEHAMSTAKDRDIVWLKCVLAKVA